MKMKTIFKGRNTFFKKTKNKKQKRDQIKIHIILKTQKHK